MDTRLPTPGEARRARAFSSKQDAGPDGKLLARGRRISAPSSCELLFPTSPPKVTGYNGSVRTKRWSPSGLCESAESHADARALQGVKLGAEAVEIPSWPSVGTSHTLLAHAPSRRIADRGGFHTDRTGGGAADPGHPARDRHSHVPRRVWTASDRAAQSNLSTAVSEIKDMFQPNQSYATVYLAAATLTATAPEYSWEQKRACTAKSPAHCVSEYPVDVVSPAGGRGVILATLSRTGLCWYVVDLESVPTTTKFTDTGGTKQFLGGRRTTSLRTTRRSAPCL